MKIKTKIILTISISVILFYFFAGLLFKLSITSYIEKREIINITEDYTKAVSIIDHEKQALMNIVLDWAEWDDTYYFTLGNNDDYIDINLQDSTLKSLNLNFMIFADNFGISKYTKYYGLESKEAVDLGKELLSRLSKNSEKYLDLESNKNPISGIYIINGDPVLLSICPIRTSDGLSFSKSLLIVGRKINQHFFDYLNKVLESDTSIQDIQLFLDNPDSEYKEESYNNIRFWLKKGDSSITSFFELSDLDGKPNILVSFNSKRSLYYNSINELVVFEIFIFLVFAFIMTAFYIVIDKVVNKPLKKMHSFISNVARKKDLTERIFLPGKNEISDLAANTNNMLKELESSYNEIKDIKERFVLIMEATNDGYFDINYLTKENYVSPSLADYVGANDELFKDLEHFLGLMHPDDRNRIANAIIERKEKRNEHIRLEFRAPTVSGEWRWLLLRGKILENDPQGSPIHIMGTVSDIHVRKQYEQENLYLSQTDVITNLKNRGYIESVIKQLNNAGEEIIWIILGDVNGLKIVNDSFGHQQGDKLLKAIGEIIENCCANDDIPARWGGDEFIILIKNKEASYVESLLENIKTKCGSLKSFPVKISMALGCAKKDIGVSDINEIIKLAEERMYRNKLLESRSARSALIASLEQTLHEKHIETEEHTRRIKQLCLQIGQRMQLTQDELDELALLGVLHDIGKIGIPESILLKPGKLTQEEFEIMKTHTEIGYRIAAATPELAHISYEILYHHERYDGTGYPQGLKGEEIPKLSRLLNIVDSFDVMTHDRHYKRAMSFEEAVFELKACSGKQFDPEMVNSFLKVITKSGQHDTE